MRQDLINLKIGNWKGVNFNLCFPLFRLACVSLFNLVKATPINRYLFYVPKEVVKGLIYVGFNWKVYNAYPKQNKGQYSKKEELIKTMLCKRFNWSDKEYRANRLAVKDDMKNIDAIKEVATAYGTTAEEKRILEIEQTKKTLFDY